MSGESPAVSVILPVRDGADHLRAAMESILAQEAVDLELLVVDDGSADDSAMIAKRLGDPRVRVLRQDPAGLGAALNHGLREARAPLIARQDADDLSLPGRLALQSRIMSDHPEVALVGGHYLSRDTESDAVRLKEIPTTDAGLSFRLLFWNTLAHGSVMFRRQAVLDLGGYQQLPRSQDYDLWLRVSARHALAAVPRPIYEWRTGPGRMSAGSGAALQASIADEISRAAISRLLPAATEEEVRDIRNLAMGPLDLLDASRGASAIEGLYRLQRAFLSRRPMHGPSGGVRTVVRRRGSRLIEYLCGQDRGGRAWAAGVRMLRQDPFATPWVVWGAWHGLLNPGRGDRKSSQSANGAGSRHGGPK